MTFVINTCKENIRFEVIKNQHNETLISVSMKIAAGIVAVSAIIFSPFLMGFGNQKGDFSYSNLLAKLGEV